MEQETLNLIVAYSTLTSAIAAIIAAVFISIQVKRMRQIQEVEIFLHIAKESESLEIRNAVDWLRFELNPNISYEEIKKDKQAWQNISTVVHFMETLGVLVDRGYISKDLIYDKMGLWICGLWGLSQKLIGAHRIAKQCPDYAENFELLVVEFESWSGKHPAKLEKRPRISRFQAESYYKGNVSIRAKKSTLRQKQVDKPDVR